MKIADSLHWNIFNIYRCAGYRVLRQPICASSDLHYCSCHCKQMQCTEWDRTPLLAHTVILQCYFTCTSLTAFSWKWQKSRNGNKLFTHLALVSFPPVPWNRTIIQVRPTPSPPPSRCLLPLPTLSVSVSLSSYTSLSVSLSLLDPSSIPSNNLLPLSYNHAPVFLPLALSLPISLQCVHSPLRSTALCPYSSSQSPATYRLAALHHPLTYTILLEEPTSCV